MQVTIFTSNSVLTVWTPYLATVVSIFHVASRALCARGVTLKGSEQCVWSTTWSVLCDSCLVRSLPVDMNWSGDRVALALTKRTCFVFAVRADHTAARPQGSAAVRQGHQHGAREQSEEQGHIPGERSGLHCPCVRAGPQTQENEQNSCDFLWSEVPPANCLQTERHAARNT